MRNKLVLGYAYALGLLEEDIAEVVILLELQLKLQRQSFEILYCHQHTNLFEIQTLLLTEP